MANVGTVNLFTEAGDLPFSYDEFVTLCKREERLSPEDKRITKIIAERLKSQRELPYTWSHQEAEYFQKNHPDKYLKYLLHRYKFRVYPKHRIVGQMPVYLLIEPTSVCNLRCTMCFQVDPTFTTSGYMGMMDLGMFKEVVDEANSQNVGAITLASRGEPTLHKEIDTMLEYLSEKFIEVKLTTNATRLTEALSHKILESGVNLVVFSVDAADAETYESIRIRGNFSEVVKNIRTFHQIREQHYPASSCTTRISGVRIRETQDLDQITTFWGKVVDEVGIKDAVERWDTYNNTPHPQLTNPCSYLWERLYIWHDGRVGVCDADYKSKLQLGRFGNKTISEVWTGEALTKLRQEHVRRLRETRYPCDRCGVDY